MKNLKKLVMFLFVMFLAITTISCTSKKKADNGEDKHNTGNIGNKQPDEVEKVVSSKITYQIEDVTLIEKEVKSNEEVELIDNIYISTAFKPFQTVKEFESLYKKYNLASNCSFIVQVDWLNGDEVVTSSTRLKEDTILKARIKTVFKSLGYKVGAVLYTTVDEVTMPTTIYACGVSLTLDTNDVTSFKKIETSIMSCLDIPGDGLYSEENNNLLAKDVKIKKLTVDAELFKDGIKKYSFRNNEYIKEIVIIGDVSKIEGLAFSKLSNLEKITIEGKIGDLASNSVSGCNNVKIK